MRWNHLGTILLFLFLAPLGSLTAQQLDWGIMNLSTHTSVGNVALHTRDAGILLVGEFRGDMDLDPSAGTSWVNNPNLAVLNTYFQKLDSNQQLLWAGTLNGNAENRGYRMVEAPNGDLLIWGVAGAGSIDFDPGPGVHNGTIASLSQFLLRLDRNGAFKWVGTMTLSGFGLPRLGVDSIGNAYIGISFDSGVDVDLGPGNTTVSATGGNDFLLAKYDTLGALVWYKAIQNSGLEAIQGMDVAGGHIGISGEFMGTIDVDPSPSTAYLFNPSPAGTCPFVASYNLNGDLEWARQITSISTHYSPLSMDPDGSVSIALAFVDSVDVDLGPGTNWLHIHPASESTVALRIDPGGNALWHALVESPTLARPLCIDTDDQGSTYIGFHYMGTVDFDPGLGIYELSNTSGTYASVIAKLNPLGDLDWAGSLDGSGQSQLASICTTGDGIVFTGKFLGTFDFAPLPADTLQFTSSSNMATSLIQWQAGACAGFHHHIDSALDATCSQPAWLVGHGFGGTPPYQYSWNTVPATAGPSASTLIGGDYTLTISDSVGCVAGAMVHVDAPVQPYGYDLQVNLVTGSFIPGSPTIVVIDAFNQGCMPVGGQVMVILDTLVTLQSSQPAPDSVAGDTLFYSFAPITFDSAHLRITQTLVTSTNATMGDSVHLGATVTPALSDLHPGDNARLGYVLPVLLAYDPNDIQVFPTGACAERYVPRSQPLTYSIRFQNTGTAEALLIVVADSLPASLDPGSLEIKGHSHPMITEWLPNNVLHFVFDGIHLPDSNTNEPASHGWVIFEIMPATGVPVGTVVENKVDIFFDFNPAVVTNTVRNTLVDVIPACAVTIGPTTERNMLEVYPNPASSALNLRHDLPMQAIQVYNLQGQGVYQWTGSQRQHHVDVRGWPQGCYIVQVRTRSGSDFVRVILAPQ